jgi:hypothetical protein
VSDEAANPEDEQVTEAQLAEMVPLEEAAGGVRMIRVIAPGWGSSGYYSADVLKRDGPSVFREGLHMYANHPTATERRERPERDVRDLAGVLASDAVWMENGQFGPGLYAKAKPVGAFKEALRDLAPHIGVSIRAAGKVRSGEAEGRKGPIVEGITAAQSVDFVTVPGAGGRVAELFESARMRAWGNQEGQGEETMAEETTNSTTAGLTEAERAQLAQVATLTETVRKQEAVIASLRTANLLRDATALAESLVTAAGVHPNARAAVVSQVTAGQVPVTEAGDLDREAFTAAVNESAKAMNTLLASVAGSPIRGMGGAPIEEAKPMATEDKEKALRESGAALGLRGAELEGFVKAGA